MFKMLQILHLLVLVLFQSCLSSSTKRILLDDNFYTIVNRLTKLENTVAGLSGNVTGNTSLQDLVQDVAWLKGQYLATLKSENATSAAIHSLQKDVEMLKAHKVNQSTTVVAFMAYLTTHERGTNHHIYFDDVKTNIGNAYNPRHGIFVAPVNGLYQFTITACSEDHHYIVLEINVKDLSIGKVIAGEGWVTACNSKVFIIQIMKGDDVFVTHSATGEWLYANVAYGLPSFTGFLIKEIPDDIRRYCNDHLGGGVTYSCDEAELLTFGPSYDCWICGFKTCQGQAVVWFKDVFIPFKPLTQAN